jgi:DNA polymerase III alpha subunit
MYSFIKLSDQSQEFETMFFSDLIDRYNDELFIGNVILIKVEAETQGDSIRLKVNDVVKLNPDSKHKFENTNDNYDKVEESLEDNLINDKCNNYTIKLQNINVIDNIASKLQSGSGTDSINLIFFDKNLKKDVNLAIGNSYLLDIDTKEYLKNLPGVEIFNKE